MNENRSRPSAWPYLVPLLILVVGFFLAVLLFGGGIAGIVGWAFDMDSEIHAMQRVVMPGSADLVLTEAGDYAIFYEYRSLVDGRSYVGSSRPPALSCALENAVGGNVPLRPAFTAEATYQTGPENLAGVWLSSFEIQRAGSYRLTCRYPNGAAQPDAVLAIGPNLIMEALAGLPGTFGPWLASGLVCCGSVLLALLAALLVVLMRRTGPRSPAGQPPSGTAA